jgi:hypothetical protein
MSTTYMVAALAAILALTFMAFRLLTRGRTLLRGPAWDGGLRHLWPQTTYSATGFSNPVRVIFDALLRPTAVEDNVEAVATHFRTAITRNYAETHIVDRLILDPPVSGLRQLAARGGRAQDARRSRQCLRGVRAADAAARPHHRLRGSSERFRLTTRMTSG